MLLVFFCARKKLENMTPMNRFKKNITPTKIKLKKYIYEVHLLLFSEGPLSSVSEFLAIFNILLHLSKVLITNNVYNEFPILSKLKAFICQSFPH